LKLLEAREWYKKISVDKTINSLRKHGFEVFHFKTKEEAANKILNIIPLTTVVGIGGSVTLRELDIPEKLRKRGNKTEDHWLERQKGTSPEKILQVRRNQINSDVFITSTNAITENGELVNIDGGGQRVAAMIFGPKKVIVVAGVNKIAKDLEEGIWRVRNIASPINAKRLNRNTPCAVTGICNDCDSPERICGVTAIYHKQMRNTPITIILIDEDLGY
jgi:L-lactate utilization protein LutB